ncbi:MAG: TatD family hydrolase [Lentisphaeraceae bacterium]|nr:TatD family hydrolase [Lentisphaeraceae bacterium]
MSKLWDKLSKNIVDTHCHILDYPTPFKLAEELDQKNISVHAVTTELDEFQELELLLKSFPTLYPSLGLFPLKVPQEIHRLDEYLELIPNLTYIGEIGLDFTVSEEEQTLQITIFKEILNECAKTNDKILSLHSRRAGKETLELVKNLYQGPAIMHWYSGPIEDALNAPRNIYFSVNTAMIKSRNGKELLKALKPEQILTETDGPYVKIGETPSRPEDIRVVIESLANKWDKTVEDTVALLNGNHQSMMKSISAS